MSYMNRSRECQISYEMGLSVTFYMRGGHVLLRKKMPHAQWHQCVLRHHVSHANLVAKPSLVNGNAEAKNTEGASFKL